MRICAKLVTVHEWRFPQVVAVIPLFLLLLGLPALGFSQTSFDVPFTYQIGGSVPAPAQYDVFSTTPLALTLITDGASWVSASLSSNTTPAVLTISVIPAGLQVGKHTSTIQITSSTGSLIFNVTLDVMAAAAGGLTLSPSAFTFNAVAGGAAPASQTLTVTAQTNTSATAQVSEQSCTNSSWLTLSPTGSFTASPANTNFTVSVNQSGMTAGTTCSGTISMTAASVTQTATVTLNVTGLTTAGLTLSPSAFSFSAVVGGAAPASQTLTVTAQTSTSATAQVSEQSCTNSNWLTLSPTGSFTASLANTTFTVSVNQSGMTAGTTCNGTISIVAASGTQTVPVTLSLVYVPPAVLTLGPSAFTFSAVAGGAAPAPQTLTVTASYDTSATAQVSEQSCANRNWLTVSPTGSFAVGPASTNFTVSVNQSGIAAGTCSGTILIIAASGVRTVFVTLNVTSAASAQLTFNVSDFPFFTVAGGAAPAPQTLTVTAQTNTSATAQASEQSCTNSSWLTLSPTGSFTASPANTNFAVSANQSGFAAGTICTGTIAMVSSSGTQTLGVTMAVATSAAGLPVVSATPTTMSFNYSAGDSNPAPQTVAISGAGAAGTFSVSTSNSAWLQVSPTCTTAAPCTTPNTGTFSLAVTADPTGLNAGATYNETIVISGLGQTTGTTNVNVSFTVTAPLPVITLVTNAASFLTGPVSPGEMISIFANPSTVIGPATAVTLSGTTCPTPCTNIPTTMGGLQVIFQPGGVAAPLTYVSSTQINCLVPYEIQVGGPVQVEVKYLGQKSNAVALQCASTQPGIFTASGTGTGLASVQQYDAQGNYEGQNSSSNPGEAGWYLTFYVTGEGIIPSPAVTGKVTSSTTVVPLLGPPNVLIDNLPSTVTYFAEADGFVSGLMQVNAIVPAGVHTGQAVSLSLSMNGNYSQSGVVIYIK